MVIVVITTKRSERILIGQPEDMVITIRFNGRIGEEKAGKVLEYISSEFPEIPIIVEHVMVFELTEDKLEE